MTGGAVMGSLPHPRPDGTPARWGADRGRLVLVRYSRGAPRSPLFDPVPRPALASSANARAPRSTAMPSDRHCCNDNITAVRCPWLGG